MLREMKHAGRYIDQKNECLIAMQYYTGLPTGGMNGRLVSGGVLLPIVSKKEPTKPVQLCKAASRRNSL